MADEQTESGGFLGGFLAGAGVGLLLAILLGGAAVYLRIKKGVSDARRGWNLVPVLVANRDLPKGTTLGPNDFAARSIPEQLLTTTVVKPEAAADVLNQRTQSDIERGEPLRWVDFDAPRPSTHSPPTNVPTFENEE